MEDKHMPTFSHHSLANNVSSEESSVNRYLRSSTAANTSCPMEKMLTPVEERPAAECASDHNELSDMEEDNSFLIFSTSNKIDAHVSSLSRSGSTLSNQGPSFSLDSEASSMKDTASILSGDCLTPVTLAGPGDDVTIGRMESEETGSGSSGGGGVDHRGREEPKVLSTQSSNDSSIFSDPLPHRPLLTKAASTTEETTSQRIPDSTRLTHELLSQSTQCFQSHVGRTAVVPPKLRSFGNTSTGNFSLSCAAILMGNPSSLEGQKKMYVSEKYAKYEQYRSSLITSTDGTKSIGGRRGDEGELHKLEPRDENDDGPNPAEEGQGTKNKEGSMSDGVVVQARSNNEGGVELKSMLDVQALASASKQCDSGIDDSPDSFKCVRERIRRRSMPLDVHLAETTPLSHAATFASRESGIADSPVPELPTDEVALHKVQASPPQQALSQQQHKQNMEDMGIGESSRQIVIITQSNSKEELLDMDTEELEAELPAVVYRHSSHFPDRNTSVPRSLENPSFSRYARTPIRDSKLLRASESPHDGMELRYRSVSMDKIPNFSNKSSEADNTLCCREIKGHGRQVKGRSVETGVDSLPGSQSISFVPYQSPTKLPGNWTSDEGDHPNTRLFLTSPEFPSPPSSSHSATLPAHSSDYTHPSMESRSTSSPSPIARQKVKLGKGLKQKLKPALRVFKIASSGSSVEAPSAIALRQPPVRKSERLEGERKRTNRSSDSSFIASYPSDEEEATGLERRARMVSPEAVDNNSERMPLSCDGVMRRSRSLEDIIGVTDSTREDESDREDSWPTTKIRGLVVLPEPKHKSRGKFFLGKARKKSGGTDSSPQLWSERSEVGPGIASKQVEEVLSLSADHSNTNKKHQRLPHFV